MVEQQGDKNFALKFNRKKYQNISFLSGTPLESKRDSDGPDQMGETGAWVAAVRHHCWVCEERDLQLPARRFQEHCK